MSAGFLWFRNEFPWLGPGFVHAVTNWDALIDYFRDVAVPERCALMWRAADEFAARHPRIFAEACVVLSGIFDGDLARRGSQVVLLLGGTGPDFRQPAGPPS